MMQYCPSCGAQLSQNAKFCTGCGAKTTSAPASEYPAHPAPEQGYQTHCTQDQEFPEPITPEQKYQTPIAQEMGYPAPNAPDQTYQTYQAPIAPEQRKSPLETEQGSGRFKSYFHKSGGLVFCAMLCVSLIPWLLNALIVIQSNDVISPTIPYMTFAVGAVAAWIALSAAAMQARKMRFSLKNYFVTFAGLFLRGGVGALAVMLLFFMGKMHFAGEFDRWQAKTPVIALIVILAIGLIESFGVAFFARLALKSEKKEAKSIKKLLLATAGFFVALIIVPAIPEAFSSLFLWTYASVPAKAAGTIIVVLLQWCALQPVFYGYASEKQENADNSLWMGSGIAKKIFSIALVAVLVASGIFAFIPALSDDPADMVIHQVSDLIDQGDIYLIRGDLLSAAACYRYAIARRDAWKLALSSDGSLWHTVKGTFNDYPLQLLLMEREKSQDRYLYSWILTEDCPVEFYFYYLDSLRKKEGKLTEPAKGETAKGVALDAKTEEKRKDILLYLVLNDIWSGNAVTISTFDDDDKAEKLLDRLEEYAEELSIREGLTVYSELVASGGILSIEMAKSAVTIAKRHPDNLYLQGLAMELGSSFTNDFYYGDVYEEAAAAALLYDELFNEQRRDATDDEKIAQKQATALALMKCRKLKESKDLLADALEVYDVPALQLLYMAVLYRNNEFEECAKQAEAMCEGEDFNPEALGLAMLSRALNREMSESVKHALKLSAAAQEGRYQTVADSLLFTYAQGISGAYIADKRFPNYDDRYNMFSAEDKELLEKDPLLNNMILAFVNWQRNKYEEAGNYIEEALKAGPGWSNLHYIKGAILFEQKEYEKALDSFFEAVTLNRSNVGAWFMIGHIYDRLKQYPEAINAFTNVIEYVPSSDHMLDHYGIAYHARKAVGTLQEYVNKEAKP